MVNGDEENSGSLGEELGLLADNGLLSDGQETQAPGSSVSVPNTVEAEAVAVSPASIEPSGSDKGEMARLLEEMDSLPALRRGAIVEGVVLSIDADGVLVNIGAKTEGLISTREMRSLEDNGEEELQVGSRVVTYVLRPDPEEGGQILLSYDRAQGERGWRILDKHLEADEPLDAPVVGHNRGGALVEVEGVQGFIPISQLASWRRTGDVEEVLAALAGESLHVKVIELNRRRRRVILSERAALQGVREEQKERLIEQLREGEIRQGRVTGLHEFGAFVDLGGADGLIHISELSWEPVQSPSDVLQVGDEVDVYIVKVDSETRRISLSLKRTKDNPWDQITSHFVEEQLVDGTITRLTPFGAFAQIQGPVEGLIHISELADGHVRHPRDVVTVGDNVVLKVLRIDPERRRLGLSLKQAQESGFGD